jgi:predicted RNA-binding Zn-ribbon protein involved in translation (DUF1610 family)
MLTVEPSDRQSRQSEESQRSESSPFAGDNHSNNARFYGVVRRIEEGVGAAMKRSPEHRHEAAVRGPRRVSNGVRRGRLLRLTGALSLLLVLYCLAFLFSARIGFVEGPGGGTACFFCGDPSLNKAAAWFFKPLLAYSENTGALRFFGDPRREIFGEDVDVRYWSSCLLPYAYDIFPRPATWMLAGLALLAVLCLTCDVWLCVRRRSRIHAGPDPPHCESCGYSLRGLEGQGEHRCPECGRPFSAKVWERYKAKKPAGGR